MIYLIFLCVGCIIGWGAFVLPGTLFLSQIGLVNSIVGIAIGAFFVSIIGLSYSFLIVKFKKRGGAFLFTLKTLGRTHAFICGWFLVLAYLAIIPLNATALSIVASAFDFSFEQFFIDIVYTFSKIFDIYVLAQSAIQFTTQTVPLYEIFGIKIHASELLVSIVAIIVVAFINLAQIKIAFWFQAIITTVLILSVLFFAICAFNNDITIINLSAFFAVPISIVAILKVLAITPWAFVGFDCGVQIIEKINITSKAFKIFTMLSIFIGFLLYITLIIVCASGISPDELANSSWAMKDATFNLGGGYATKILAFGVFVAVISGLNGFFITTKELLFSMSENKVLPKYFSNNKRATFFIAFISCIAPFFGRESLMYIVDMSSIGIVIAFLYVSIVCFKFEDSNKLLAVFSTILSIFFIALLFLPFSPSVLKIPSLIALVVWTSAGIIFYFVKKNSYNIKYR